MFHACQTTVKSSPSVTTAVDERAARRARVERDWARQKLRKNLLVTGVVLLATAGIAAGVYASMKANETGPRSVHFHEGFAAFVNGEPVPYANPAVSGMNGYAVHVHPPSYGTWHYETRLKETSVKDILRYYYKTRLTEDVLILPPESGRPGTYTSTDESPLRFFWQPSVAQPWREGWGPVERWLPEGGERFLLLYGTYTDAEVAALQERVPIPPGEARPGDMSAANATNDTGS